MKNVTLLTCLLALTLGASAQSSRSVNPIAIPPNARGGERGSAVGITTTPNAVAAKSVSGTAQPAPIAHKTPPNSTVPPVPKK